MELLVVVTIVGILAALALPSYQSYRLKTNRSIGGECLIEAQRRVENVYAQTQKIPADLTGAGYANDPFDCGDQKLYSVTLLAASAACPKPACVQLTATALDSQLKDGNLRLTYDASQNFRMTVSAGQTTANASYVKEHQPSGSTDWKPSWDFQPGQ